jgi:hypothetical protein
MQNHNLVDLVKKVYQLVNQPLSMDNGAYLCAKMIEENKLKIREEVFNLRVAGNRLIDQMNDQKLRLEFDTDPAIKISAYLQSNSRIEDFVFSQLKNILMPCWGVYWKEGCNTIDNIVYWVTMAEQDEERKLKAFLSEKQ